MKSVNPHNGEKVEEYSKHTDDDVESALSAAESTFNSWRKIELTERCKLLTRASEVLRSNVDRFAEIIVREMGKPVSEARAEVKKCAWVCDHYAEHAPSYLQESVLSSEPDAETRVVHEPLGPVLAIMPWNYPFWQVFRFAAPTLTAGNVGILKHASNVPGCALAIEEVFEEAGYPDDAFQTLLIGSGKVDNLLADNRIRAATLTGSTPAGRSVASTAGEHLKKTVLELGGSDPFIVLDDADIERAASVGARARTLNSGQSCIAAKRFIVHTDIADDFVRSLVSEIEKLTVGDPMEETTDIGPQAREDLMEELHSQVTTSVEAGATVEIGGEPLSREGHYYPPTVLTDVPVDSPAYCEELFGPVASVIEVANDDEAVSVANDSDFGLGASIWTEDLDRGRQLSRQVESGAVFVNELVKSDPRLPFGGIKDSGYGRELAGDGIREFVNKKLVWVHHE